MLLLYHLSFPCILIGLQMIFIFIYYIPRLWDDCPPNLELKLLVIVVAPQMSPICDWRASQLIRATSDLQRERERGGDEWWHMTWSRDQIMFTQRIIRVTPNSLEIIHNTHSERSEELGLGKSADCGLARRRGNCALLAAHYKMFDMINTFSPSL